MLLMTLVISAIFIELSDILSIVLTTSFTMSPPWAALPDAFAANWLAWWAFSAFCLTVAVSCSMLAAVCSSEAACCSVRAERSVLPSAISLDP
ncbi:Uncharacterised protein [Yersinia enterocolitica]|nr:Uncharacterised protein [Yersinia enterocolitica]